MKKTPAFLLALLLAAPASALDALLLRERLAAFDVPSVGPAAAAPDATAVKPSAYEQAHFLDTPSLEAVRSFPPPPAAGSPEFQNDFAVLHAWQARRTEEQCAAAQAESIPSYENMFGPASPFPVPLRGEPKAFFTAVAGDAGAATHPRPPLTDPSLRPCITLPKGKAYPSGHATAARLYALVLAELVPARQAEFLAVGERSALYRVIGGVHHPSDIAAGRRLADALFVELMRTPGFRAELSRLRNQLP
ncbi:MAG: acid phosphatase (class A) [Elusimicrobia bacterium]|nr:MAG: acid phosphatase (class A) [Elusimicrobiota bacterium]